MEYLLSTVLDSVSWLTAILALVVCLIFYAYIQWSYMPPGPIGLPYLGYYPFLRKDYHVQLREMVKKYGEVFCIRSTGQLYVYLDNIRVVKEAHITKSDCFAQRPTNFSLFLDTFGGGVFYLNGEKWKEMRKFFVLKMKEFGLGKKTQENLAVDFLRKGLDTIRKKNEKFSALEFFGDISSKAIFEMLLSGTKASDDDIKTFNETYSIVLDTAVGTNIMLSGPLLKYVMLYWKPEFRKYRKNLVRMINILYKIVQDHEKDFDKDNIRDLVDSYINERREAERKGDPKSKILTDKALVYTLVQLIGDGGYSVGIMIALLLKELSKRPEVQKEIQREIDDVIGHNRFPSWEDKSRMPYTYSTIWESFRIGDFFPAFPSLECTKETTVGDCRVPKGAITLVNFWSVFHDPEVYKEPEKFDPTRFMPNDENKPRTELPILFGVGKRSCIGEPLVIMETFLFVTSVLQNFDLHLAEDDAPESSAKKEEEEFKIFFRVTPRTS